MQLTEGQSYSERHENVEFMRDYHHTRPEHNHLLNIKKCTKKIDISFYMKAVKCQLFPFINDCLVGLVVKAPASRAEDHGFESCLHWDFF